MIEIMFVVYERAGCDGVGRYRGVAWRIWIYDYTYAK
jgi:hypothetical protein